MDYILPVAVRRITAVPQQVECNWTNSYTLESIAKAQEENEDLSRVRKWVTDDDQPISAENR